MDQTYQSDKPFTGEMIDIDEIKDFAGKSGYFKVNIKIPDELLIKPEMLSSISTTIPSTIMSLPMDDLLKQNQQLQDYTKKLEDDFNSYKLKTEEQLALITQLLQQK